MAEKVQQDTREERRKQALRDNLKRRKQAARKASDGDRRDPAPVKGK